MCVVDFHTRLGEEGVRESLPTTLLTYCQQIATGMAFLVDRGCVVSTLATKYILVSEGDVCKVNPCCQSFWEPLHPRDNLRLGSCISQGVMHDEGSLANRYIALLRFKPSCHNKVLNRMQGHK